MDHGLTGLTGLTGPAAQERRKKTFFSASKGGDERFVGHHVMRGFWACCPGCA